MVGGGALAENEDDERKANVIKYLSIQPNVRGPTLTDSEEFVEQFLRVLRRHWDLLEDVLVNTRAYHDGLHVCEQARATADRLHSIGRINESTWQFADRQILWLNLVMLDKLDYWEDYIRLFEEARTTRTVSAYLEKRDRAYVVNYKACHSYVVLQDEDDVFLHFLFLQRDRYDLIREKLKKYRAGNKLGNMRHRKHSELTDEEIHKRFLDVLQRYSWHSIFYHIYV